MSDIVIKGMELPKDPIDYLHLIIQDGKVHTAISCGHLTTDKLNVADAIEVPPHGDLISKQETVKKLMDSMCEGCKHTDDCGWCAMAEYRRIVENAPTVIEATEERE